MGVNRRTNSVGGVKDNAKPAGSRVFQILQSGVSGCAAGGSHQPSVYDLRGDGAAVFGSAHAKRL